MAYGKIETEVRRLTIDGGAHKLATYADQQQAQIDDCCKKHDDADGPVLRGKEADALRAKLVSLGEELGELDGLRRKVAALADEVTALKARIKDPAPAP